MIQQPVWPEIECSGLTLMKSHRNNRMTPDWPLLCVRNAHRPIRKAMDVLGGSRKVGVVFTCRVLHAHRDAIVASSTLSKVIRLEVEGGFREAISVRIVVDRVHEVECIRNCRADVCRDGRSLGSILGVDEVKRRRGLGRSSGAFSREDVVAATGCQGTGTPVIKMGTHAVVVVDVVPSLCQPRGDAVKSWGSMRVWKPCVRI